MMRFPGIAIVIAFAMVQPANAHDEPDNTTAEAEIEASINALMQAYTEADAATIERLMAKPYSHINNGGKPVPREDYLAWQRSRQKRAEGGSPDPMSFEISDVVVTMHNETTATATGLGLLQGEREGKPWKLKFRFTNLWLLNDGQWQRAAFHDTYLESE